MREALDRRGQRIRVGRSRDSADSSGSAQGQRGQFSGDESRQHAGPLVGSTGRDVELRLPERRKCGRLPGQLGRRRGRCRASQNRRDRRPIVCQSGGYRAGPHQLVELVEIRAVRRSDGERWAVASHDEERRVAT